MLAGGGLDRQLGEPRRRVAPFARIAQIDREARQALNRLGHVLATNGTGHDGLDLGNVEPVAGRGDPVDLHIDVAPASQPFGQRGAYTGNSLCDLFGFTRHPVDLDNIVTRHLDPDRAFDACGEHINPVPDRRHPDVGEAGDADGLIELIDQLFGCHPGAP